MKKQSDKIGTFGIIGGVLAFLVGYPISSVIRSAINIENYWLVAILYFAITTVFAWLFMKIGRKIDDRREEQRRIEEDKEDEDD